LAMFVPLLYGVDLPKGVSTIPYGLLGVYAVGASPLGFGLIAVWFFTYILRDIMARKRFKHAFGVDVFLGWGILVLLPTLAMFMAKYQTLSLGFGAEAPQADASFLSAVAVQSIVLFSSWPIIAILLVFFPLWAGYTLIKKGFTAALFDHSHIVIPSLLVIGYVFVAGGVYLSGFAAAHPPFGQGFIHYALHLQFLILLPLWRLVYDVLQAMFPRQQNGVSGALSLVAALMFVGVIVTNAERLKFEPSAPLDHTLRVAEALKAEQIVGWRDKVAVLDGAETRGYYAVALSYGLRHHASVRPVLQELADAQGHFDRFHDALVAGAYDFLWVHAVTPDIAAVLGDQLRADTSYLYHVTAKGLTPIKSYAHGAYTYKTAGYIPKL